MVPAKTVLAGPFIRTALSPPGQSMVNVPPRVSARTGEWSSPEQVLPLIEQRRAEQAAWAAQEPAEVVAD